MRFHALDARAGSQGLLPPSLASGEVHVWRIDLSGASHAARESCLHDSDRRRAARFAFERDRTRFLRMRSALLHLLAAYLDIPALEVPISIDVKGKPFLPGRCGLGFNLSHSGNLGLVAVGRAPHIGVDVEETGPRRELRDLVPAVCSVEEARCLHDVDDAEFQMAFLTCWTRKEAVLKALGAGITNDLRRLDVGITTERRRIAADWTGADASVTVESVIHDERGVGSLAVVGGMSGTKILELDPPGASP